VSGKKARQPRASSKGRGRRDCGLRAGPPRSPGNATIRRWRGRWRRAAA